MTTTRETVLAIIARVSGKDTSVIRPESELVANLGMDSARALELLVELEDHLEIEISDEEAGRLITVGDILEYVDHLET